MQQLGQELGSLPRQCKASWTSVATRSCPGPYPMVACPEFHLDFRPGRELFTLLICWYQCLWNHGQQLKRLHHSVAVTLAPVQVPIPRSLVPSVTLVVGQTENFLPCSCIYSHPQYSIEQRYWFPALGDSILNFFLHFTIFI